MSTTNKGHQNLIPWVKGQSGNPSGRPKRLPISDALRDLLDRRLNDDETAAKPRKRRMTVAEKMADQLARRALHGDVEALREIANRVEGKPTQRIEVAPDIEGLKEIKVEVTFVKSDTPR
jgi:hypothetical protein